MGYFHASKLLKLAFLSSLTRKYVIWKGFYHNFSAKKASASGGFAPTKGLCPLDPRGSFALPNDLPWRHPCAHTHMPMPTYHAYVGWVRVCVHTWVYEYSFMHVYVCMHACVCLFFMRLFMHAHALTRACTHTLTHHMHPKQACS